MYVPWARAAPDTSSRTLMLTPEGAKRVKFFDPAALEKDVCGAWLLPDNRVVCERVTHTADSLPICAQWCFSTLDEFRAAVAASRAKGGTYNEV